MLCVTTDRQTDIHKKYKICIQKFLIKPIFLKILLAILYEGILS